ncbi:MAG: D-alanine--D-alanine ligase, partial [Kiritimatiellaeota bacterium]|nr:D-alanine--D-alanine ligase [Kiritimatiellota bacterium]
MSRSIKKVAVLMGGTSSEREISIKSGNAATGALREAGYDVTPFTLERDALPDLAGIEAVFIALHGRFGEDGGVQRLLEARGIPYTGSGPEASELSFDKILTQQRLLSAGIPVPRHTILTFEGDDGLLPLSR